MVLSTESKFPSRRSYVIKVRSNASRDALAGRLENLVTGRQHDFASGAELLEAIANDLHADGGRSEPGCDLPDEVK